MTTGEILYLLLVIGTFVVFSGTLAVETAAWERLKRTREATRPTRMPGHA